MKNLMFFAALLTALPLTVQAQDDMYFVPTKKNVEKARVAYEAQNEPYNYYSGPSRSVDEYNRRYAGSSYEVLPADSGMVDVIDFSAVEGVYPDSTADFQLTRQMTRWDGYTPTDAYWEGYSAGREDGWSQSAWHSPWYYTSYYPWYDSWYDPWYYSSWHWGWGGWYDPWYYSWHRPYYEWYDWGWHRPYVGGGGRFVPRNSPYTARTGRSRVGGVRSSSTRIGSNAGGSVGTRRAGTVAGSRSASSASRSSANRIGSGSSYTPSRSSSSSSVSSSRSSGISVGSRSSGGSFGGSRSSGGSFGGGRSSGGGSRSGGRR